MNSINNVAKSVFNKTTQSKNNDNCPQTPSKMILQPENVTIFSEKDDSDKSNGELQIVENLRITRSKKRKR